MAPKTTTVTSIKSRSQFQKSWNRTTKMDFLYVFDLYQSWSGSCFDQTLLPTIESLLREYDCFGNTNTKKGKRLKFLSMEINKEEYRSALQDKVFKKGEGDNNVTGDSNKAAGGDDLLAMNDLIDGEDNVSDVIQNLSSRGCCPLMIGVKNGKIIFLIQGANLPKLKKMVAEHIPKVDEDDDDEDDDEDEEIDDSDDELEAETAN